MLYIDIQLHIIHFILDLEKQVKFKKKIKGEERLLPNGSVSYDGCAMSYSVCGCEWYLRENWNHHHGDEE